MKSLQSLRLENESKNREIDFDRSVDKQIDRLTERERKKERERVRGGEEMEGWEQKGPGVRPLRIWVHKKRGAGGNGRR